MNYNVLPRLKSIGQFLDALIIVKCYPLRTDGRTDINYKEKLCFQKVTLLKSK